ncbi:hypothetical protein O3G_MSEX008740 [Manduca sexta]|nr:hypothetical protein O3G_MSEX008740 [Manduca sexta]
MLINANIPLRFKPSEFQCFNWIYKLAPCFPINASKINIINDPKKFYDTLYNRFCNAKRRISIASLYIGTGSLEKELINVTKSNVLSKNDLRLNVLLDNQRGTRGVENSVTLLKELINSASEQCRVSLYQTPRLQGVWSKVLPSRYNELVGLQHMKLYIADDSVLLSGANCSNDYFQQRQDRYIEIQDADLANFYNEIIDTVSNYSKECLGNDIIDVKYDKTQMIQELNKNVLSCVEKWKHTQTQKCLNNSSEEDTWIFPLIQMGEFNITQDEEVTRKLLQTASKGSYIQLATGYFNLTNRYADTLLKECKANISLLMAHPNANGFLGAAGPAGGIPHAYSLIARKFWQRVADSNQASRVRMLEYERPGWTFHAKGLW